MSIMSSWSSPNLCPAYEKKNKHKIREWVSGYQLNERERDRGLGNESLEFEQDPFPKNDGEKNLQNQKKIQNKNDVEKFTLGSQIYQFTILFAPFLEFESDILQRAM